MIEREVLWRYVGTANTVAIFRTCDELTKDIAYRVKICRIAADIKERKRALPEFPGVIKANPAYWAHGRLDEGAITSWYAALTKCISSYKRPGTLHDGLHQHGTVPPPARGE